MRGGETGRWVEVVRRKDKIRWKKEARKVKETERWKRK